LIEMGREGPSYTIDTLRTLRGSRPSDEIYFLAGCDALNALHTWHEPDALLAEFQVVIMDRPIEGAVNWEEVESRFAGIRRRITVADVAELEISGEDIRRRVREGRPIRYYVPAPVARYIRRNCLYRDPPGPCSS
jgi:nicotinate-nucleotide adenylyltransferase